MTGVVLLIIALLVLVLERRSVWYRSRIDSVFADHTCDSPTLAEIQERLAAVNTECSKYEFTAIRRVNIRFREHLVSLACGPVGSMTIGKLGLTWRGVDSLFAVVDTTETNWMLANPDVFRPAFIGTQFSVFWTVISKF